MEDRVNVIELDSPQPVRQNKPGKEKKGRKGLKIFVILLVVIILAGLLSIALMGGGKDSGTLLIGNNGKISMHEPYIGELYVSGEIGAESVGALGGSSSYQHNWTLNRIDEMIKDRNNKGILMYVDSPGGAVFETDELYLKLMEYRKKTRRPVYTYMASQAASGGYYISAASDKIYANRNCWTGSIGVIMGPIYDFTDLLDKYGVKTVTIASGKNKGMGSSTAHMTQEQKDILQEVIDEAYDQFVDCVAKGRDMDEKKVRELADGRLYTAKQARANGLIDQIGTRKETVAAMKAAYNLKGVSLVPIVYDPELSMLQEILQSVNALGESKADSDLAALKSLMEKGQTTTVSYLAQVQK